MILKASQRGGGRQLAAHLLNAKDNEHVHVHEMRGFVSDDLGDAFDEAYATSRATKAKQFLFSLSLNPPQDAQVSADEFEAAIEAIERKVGLEGQPRAIVFHEKDGRRHAHAVWSRIDADRMKAINLPFFKTKLMDVSRELYLEHGWQMPRGLISWKERDPANFTLAEWQQAKRSGQDPKALKAMFTECWAASDSKEAFAAALKARGYTLSRGDRRSHVAVDFRGEVYAIARYAGIKTKDVRARLGDPDALPSINRAIIGHADRMTPMLEKYVREAEARHSMRKASLAFRRTETLQRQRAERAKLDQEHEARRVRETQARQARLRTGWRGLWDRMTGTHAKTKTQNEQEALEAHQRDRAERERLIFRQLDLRRTLDQQIKQARQEQVEQVGELHRDIANYREFGKEPPAIKQRSTAREAAPERMRTSERPRRRDRDRGPEFER